MATTAIIEGCTDAGLAPGEGVRATLDGPEQAEMFDDDAALVDKQIGRTPIGWKGGRAKGSKNRATRDVVEYVRAAGTDPLLWMSKVASMSMADLHDFVGGGKPIELAEFQRRVVKDLRDTLYPGQTIADVLKAAMGDNALAVVGFMAMRDADPAAVGAAGPDIHGGLKAQEARQRVPINTEENQPVSPAPPDKIAETESRRNDACD